MQQSNKNKIVEVIDINVEEIQFAQKTNKNGVSCFKSLDKHRDDLIGKCIYITVVSERGRRLVFTLRIVKIEDKDKGDKYLHLEVLETGATFPRQTHDITSLINQPNKPTNINLLNNKLYGDTVNTNTKRGKAKHDIDWEPLFNSKLDTKGHIGGVYLITGTILGVKYYYIGVTDDYKQRFKGHYKEGSGGRYGITTNMLLQAEDGIMEAIVLKDKVFDRDYMEHVMETVFTNLFDYTEVKVVNSLESGKYKTREELIELLILTPATEVQILWNSYEVLKPYQLGISDEGLYYMNQLYKLAYSVDMPQGLAQLLDELEVTLEEFITNIKLVELPRRGYGKQTTDKKMNPTEMPKGRSKNRFDGYLGYKYNENPKFNKSKPYYKYHNGRWENLSVKDMEQLVQTYVDRNKYAILDVSIVRGSYGRIYRLEVLTTKETTVLQFRS